MTSPDSTAEMISEFQRRPLDLARRLLAMSLSQLAKREYLYEVSSPYADAESSVMEGAFAGHVLSALSSLAFAYEQQVARNAKLTTEQAVAHAKLYDLEAKLARNTPITGRDVLLASMGTGNVNDDDEESLQFADESE